MFWCNVVRMFQQNAVRVYTEFHRGLIRREESRHRIRSMEVSPGSTRVSRETDIAFSRL